MPVSSQPLQLWCVHGNLQTPTVWAPLTAYLKQRQPNLQVHAENLWETLAQDGWVWADGFCQRVQRLGPSRRVLLGYSLGGRLALHGLLHQPGLWAGAVIVAADPGMASGHEAQLKRDRTWAHRFLTEPLDQVLADWNRLPLFGGKPGPTCDLAPYREAIASAFVNYSKGRQADLRSRLTTLRHPPVLYISGTEDIKYRTLGQELARLCPTVEHSAISDAGHRVPWDNPTGCNLRIITFLNQI